MVLVAGAVLASGCATEGKLKDRIDVPLGKHCKIDTEDAKVRCKWRF